MRLITRTEQLHQRAWQKTVLRTRKTCPDKNLHRYSDAIKTEINAGGGWGLTVIKGSKWRLHVLKVELEKNIA